jgi:hypothetical protein
MSEISYASIRRNPINAGEVAKRLASGDLRPEAISLRDLAESLMGVGWVRDLDPRGVLADLASHRKDLESMCGQLLVVTINAMIYAKVMEAYTQEAFVVSKLVPSRHSESAIGETPETTSRGLIVPVDGDAIFFDRTSLVLARAAEVGEVIGLNKEKRLLDAVIGTTNTYTWQGRKFDTYQDASGNRPWINSLVGNELVEPSNLNAAEALFADNIDPETGDPIIGNPNTLLAMPAARYAASMITSESARSYTVIDSRLAYRRLIASGVPANEAKTWWFLGDFKRAFAYSEEWPLTVTCRTGGDLSGSLLRFKVSESGSAVAVNPRYVVRSTGNREAVN